MVTGVDPGHRGNVDEFADSAMGKVTVLGDITVVAEAYVLQAAVTLHLSVLTEGAFGYGNIGSDTWFRTQLGERTGIL
jgi:hypothetical protein